MVANIQVRRIIHLKLGSQNTEAVSKAEYLYNLYGHHPASSIAEHLIESGHRINIIEAFNVLFKSTNGNSLRLIEALVIQKFRNNSLSPYHCHDSVGNFL